MGDQVASFGADPEAQDHAAQHRADKDGGAPSQPTPPLNNPDKLLASFSEGLHSRVH